MKVAVVGGGAWGTALADLLARKGEQVTLWAREADVVDSVNRKHRNEMFLPGASLAPALRAEAAKTLDRSRPLVVSASKGLDPERLERPSCVLAEVLSPGTPVAVLSGPSFAWEVFSQQPTAVVTATGALSRNRTLGVALGQGQTLQQALAGKAAVVEGVNTTRTAVALGERHGVEMPIAREVANVLFQNKPPRQAVSDLMERELKAETR